MTDNEFALADRIQKIKSINEQYDLEHNAYISFSGGKDSTILHYLIDEALPNNNIPRLFLNTGLEYKDILNFVRELAEKDKRIIIYNVGVNIPKMLEEEGYPFKSKIHSQKVAEWRRGYRAKSHRQYFRLEGGGLKCPHALLYQTEDTRLKISDKCCVYLKKKPAEDWSKANKRPITITGMRASEGGQRMNINCIVINRSHKFVKFHPLSIVSNEFEDWYIKHRDIQLCKLYYPPFNFTRTGCKGCPYTPWLSKDLELLKTYLPSEAKQCERLWKPVYDEYRRIGYRLNKQGDNYGNN